MMVDIRESRRIVGWISAAHPPYQRQKVDALRLSTLFSENKFTVIGEVKVGDLAGFHVHKFTFNRQQYLIAYRHENDTLTFYMVGTHENFYDELKRYLKALK